MQKFVPRSEKSIWSRINREKALALIQSGKMKPSGKALKANPGATAFFETLDRGNRYAMLFRIQTAKKAETRARKIREFVEMLERKETIHPARKATKNRGAAKGPEKQIPRLAWNDG